MKNSYVFLFVLLLCNAARAQFNLGIKAVMNVSQISIEGNTSSARFGFAGGGYAEYSFNRQIGLTAELLYNEKGGKETTSNTEIKTNLNYLSLPILFYFEPLQNLKLGLGPELAFLLNAKAKGDSISTTDIKKYYESFDKAIAIGGSYSFGRLGITARYVGGFNGITTLTFTDPNSGGEVTKKAGSNRVIQFALFYQLTQNKFSNPRANK